MNNNLRINNLEFAQKQQRMSDTIPLAQFPRLNALLSNTKDAALQFVLLGQNEIFRHPGLRLRIQGGLPVICQRCLQAMNLDVNLQFTYLIGEEETDDNDEIDWLEPAQDMDLLALIEDEVLLAMPIAPMHDEKCTDAVMQSGEKANPFAVLKGKF